MDHPITVTFKLNGKPTALAVEPLTTLRSALREHVHLHATKLTLVRSLVEMLLQIDPRQSGT